jgi:hypothetical protein
MLVVEQDPSLLLKKEKNRITKPFGCVCGRPGLVNSAKFLKINSNIPTFLHQINHFLSFSNK